MTQAKKLQFNEKPSATNNIGQDIHGAARHHRDTYETPEELRKKAQVKQSKKSVKDLESQYKTLFSEALGQSTEASQDVLKRYEFKKCILSCELLSENSGLLESCSIQDFRALVTNETDRQKREILRKKFNGLVTKQNKIRYIRPIELSKYFDKKTKEAFKEVNGHCVPWSTSSTSFDASKLATLVRGVQFGNTLTENERVYVSENLQKSIESLSQVFDIDFTKLGFSFGARGKSGSIAHYQDSEKVLAFNRGWDGALIHELGHAIDYSLGLVSKKMPWSIRSKYEAKLIEQGTPRSLLKYYRDPKEIFARLFEAYIHETFAARTEFMIFLNKDSKIPDFGPEELEFMLETLKPILKNKGQN